MIWTTFQSSTFTGEYNFAGGIWKKQKSIFRLVKTGGENYVTINIYGDIPSVEFRLEYDANGEILMDISDFFSGAAIGDNVYVSISNTDGYEINEQVRGDIAPASMIIPEQRGAFQDYMPILPPYKMLQMPFGLFNTTNIFRSDFGFVAYSFDGVDYVGIISDSLQELNLQSNVLYFRVRNTPQEEWRITQYILEPLKCGKRYAAVRWIGSTGLLKQHTFEVLDVTHKTNGVEILNPYGVERSIKSQEVSFILRLKDLTPYDYWYYSDIITSDDVRVAISEEDADFGYETIVNVITKSTTIPNCGTKTLEVEITFRGYGKN
jgi:hypothetical protein